MELNDWRLLVWRCLFTVVITFLIVSLGAPLLISVGWLNDTGFFLLTMAICTAVWYFMPWADDRWHRNDNR